MSGRLILRVVSGRVKQVCVQLPIRRPTLRTWRCYSHVAAAAIDQHLSAGPTAANLQQRVCYCRPMLRQTYGHRTVSQTCFAYYAGSANNPKSASCGETKSQVDKSDENRKLTKKANTLKTVSPIILACKLTL